MGMYLRAKFNVSSIILTSFRRGVILPPSPTSKRTPKKPTQIRVNFVYNKVGRINFSGELDVLVITIELLEKTISNIFLIFY